MRISKKKLLSLINENLEEMAMDFTTPDRPNRDIERALSTGDTTHKKVPYPEMPNKNFQEVLASERYKKVIQKLRTYVPNAPILRGGNTIEDLMAMAPLVQMMGVAHSNITQIEHNYKKELEDLAVKLVTNEMHIPEGSITFDARIVGMGTVPVNDFNRENNRLKREPQNPQNPQEPQNQENPQEEAKKEVEMDLAAKLENFNIESAKRRVINSIIQGASKRGHYMYSYVADELRRITGSDTLIEQYGILMSINDTLYWQLSDDNLKMAMGQQGVGGKVNVDIESGRAKNNPPNAGQNNPQQNFGDEDQNDDENDQENDSENEIQNTRDVPHITAIGVNFPILVHELIKGVMEVFGTRGRSEEYVDIEDDEDTLESEVWDLRLGPSIWDRLREYFPEDFLIDNPELQNYLLVSIFELPAKKFLVFFKEIFLRTELGQKLIDEIVENVRKIYNNDETDDFSEETEYELDEVTETTSDEDLRSFLTSLGITLDEPLENDDYFSKN